MHSKIIYELQAFVLLKGFLNAKRKQKLTSTRRRDVLSLTNG